MDRGFSAMRVLASAMLSCLFLCGCDARPAVPRPGTSTSSTAAPVEREPTVDDGVSPSYRTGSPIRSVVGKGHVLTGVVVSAFDGSPIANAKVELWPEYAGRGHPDDARATVFTDKSGRYRFQCDPPEHIHMRVSADGYVTIGQNNYHPDGRSMGKFDIVLRPD